MPTPTWIFHSGISKRRAGCGRSAGRSSSVQSERREPSRRESGRSAILLFGLNLIGLGLGPTLVGILNDALAPRYGAGAVRVSLLLISCLNLWGAVHSLIATRRVRTEVSGTP